MLRYKIAPKCLLPGPFGHSDVGGNPGVAGRFVAIISFLHTPVSSPDPGMDALALWDDNGNGRITCAEARAHGIAPVRRGHPAYQYMRDADGDGVVCE